MKLVDLEATETRTKYNNYLSIGFSDAVFEQLSLYRENREAAGFVRLAVGVLLAITSDDNGAIECVADELTCACGRTVDLDLLAMGCLVLSAELEKRLKQIENGS